MGFIYTLVCLTLVLIWLPWLWRYKMRPQLVASELNRQLQGHPQRKAFVQTIGLLTTLYRGLNTARVSRRERERLKLKEDAFVYGEIDFLAFLLILEKASLQAGEIFYDLGSGAGKAVFTAALSYDLSKACGFELLPGLYKLANIQKNKARTLASLIDKKRLALYLHRITSIKFINDNFLNSDLADGDLIFINATCLSPATWRALVQKLSYLKPGSRVITTTKKIESPLFEVVYQGQTLMSWGVNSINIYRRANDAIASGKY